MNIVTNNIEFAESKNAGSDNSGYVPANPPAGEAPDNDFMNLPDIKDSDLPF